MSKKSLLLRCVLLIILAVSLVLPIFSQPVYADDCADGEVATSIFGCVKDDGQGSSMFGILKLVTTILSVGMGILAVIGISVSGVMYLTSAGNTEQAMKARRRILEITIGLALFSVSSALIGWLVGGQNSTSTNTQQSSTTTSSTTTESSKTQNQTKSQTKPSSSTKTDSESKNTNNTNDKSSNNTKNNTTKNNANKNNTTKKTEKTDEEKNAEKIKLLNQTAIKLAWPYGNSSKASKNPTTAFKKAFESANMADVDLRATGKYKKYLNNNVTEKQRQCRLKGMACGMFVGTVYRSSGVDKNLPAMARFIYKYVKSSKKYKKITDKSKVQEGDIQLFVNKDGYATHVAMLVKIDGKLYTAEGSLCSYYGKISTKGTTSRSNRTLVIYRYIGT